MGYSTCGMHGARGPRTCGNCDRCPRCYGLRVTLHDCPYGWCGGVRYCADCWRKHGAEARAYHVTARCAAESARYASERALKAALLADGRLVRRAALAMPTASEPDRVHVLFEGAGGRTLGFYMDVATYRAIELGVPATVEDYSAAGNVWPAPAAFDYRKATADVT